MRRRYSRDHITLNHWVVSDHLSVFLVLSCVQQVGVYEYRDNSPLVCLRDLQNGID